MTGHQQSPINLGNAFAVPELRTALVIDWPSGPQAFTPSRGGHGYRYAPDSDKNTIRVDGEIYTLSDVHFHRPSEHWVDGERRAAEMHAVHHRVTDGIRRCVIAVFLDLGTGHDDPADPPTPVSIDLAGLLPGPGDRTHYRYEGSLTTPGYDENVSWVVMKRTVTVRAGDLAALVRHHADGARDPQPLNRRFVLTDA
ncbi:carbonic anhydrase family protein [Actinophytocola oryzae]|uniref:carbonic anhydrase n=1 Tax=Actinophytocola oryzae TaxID=502181 RepID=A0A4R7W6Y0_9PSEU|nr:carbonic anhydrase family protein [Actinophytocola oryzae]TDV57928.1 carbonic anhydrase [Actinophytocola oryzae]